MITATEVKFNPIELLIYRNYSIPKNKNFELLTNKKIVDSSDMFIWKAARCSRLI